MCGLSGFYCPSGFQSRDGIELAQKMANAITHRGPDDFGEWVDGDAGIALSHRRLSILDLSDAGHQPMISQSGRFVLAFNGEIYNHLEIRKKIDSFDNVSWNGHSDTETLLAGFEHFGFEDTLKQTVGTFAIALWDRKNHVLSIARDRMGEKPLYYGWQNSVFLFGSELKALRQHSSFQNDIHYNVIEPFLQYGSISAPSSIYKGIYKLVPGSYIHISSESDRNSYQKPSKYWDLHCISNEGLRSPFQGNDNEAIDYLDGLVKESVKLQTISDVPLGAFLSGGVDSSLITALLQSVSTDKIKTFTIGFEEQNYNEAVYAEEIANYLGTDHTTLYLSEKEIINSIPNIHDIYDEPFSDSGGALQVSTLAGNHVKVALSGDGGDELFAGYDVYSKLNRVNNIFSKIPSNIRNIIFNVMSSIHPNISNYPLSLILELANRKTTIPLSMRLDQLILALKSLSHIDFYRLMKSNGLIEQQIMEKRHLNSRNPLRFDTSDLDQFVSSLLYYDQVDYLPSDILVKADRTSMSVGLENRAPLLDHRIVEFSWRLSNDMKIRNGINKWPLRQVLYRYIPQNLVDRPKMGFSLPMSEWLRGPLRSWTEDLLSKDLIERHGIFNADHVQSILKQHMEGKYNWQATLWRLMAFQCWLLNR